MVEQLILVDADDKIIGYDTKENVHHGKGKLHRAFSIFIFKSDGRLLLQKRSRYKSLWPMFWSNSVCSHPRKGEATEAAARRRLVDELGIRTNIDYLYTFKYNAPYMEYGSESEVCSVYYGFHDGKIIMNPQEVKSIRFIDSHLVSNEIERSPEMFTPWFKMEWQRIESEFLYRIKTSRIG